MDKTNIAPLSMAKSQTQYKWVILFLWHFDCEYPFSMVPLEIFNGDSGFPMHLITGPLTDESRMGSHTLSSLANNNYAVFCKVQEGKYVFKQVKRNYKLIFIM